MIHNEVKISKNPDTFLLVNLQITWLNSTFKFMKNMHRIQLISILAKLIHNLENIRFCLGATIVLE